MPRFENEGCNPNKNDAHNLDRTVPDEENYYSFSPIDLNFNNRETEKKIVKDNQNNQAGVNPCNDYEDYLPPPLREQNTAPQAFKSEQFTDFYTGRSTANNHKPEKKHKNSGGDKKGRKFKLSTGKKVLIAVLAVLILIVGSIFPVLGRISYDEKKESEYVDAAELKSSPLVKNILLLGVDARSNDKAEASRSDTMMLVSLDMKHHSIKLVSFLRDTWVYIPSLEGEQRLNAACSSGGYQGVVDTIEYNFGVKIDSYVVTDFEMFKVLVDSLGGVEVDVTKAEAKEVTNHPKRYGGVKLESGKNTLTGEQALAYCRIRKIDTDFVRTKRQRTVMNAIIDKAKHSNPFKLYNMAFKSAPYIQTNMTKGELTSFVAKAGYCVTGDIHQQKVPFENTWEYATIRGNSVIAINKEKNKDKLIEFIYDKSSADIKADEDKSK